MQIIHVSKLRSGNWMKSDRK